jgi:hypothetical protein
MGRVNIDSDHYLLTSKIRGKISNARTLIPRNLIARD